MSFEIHKGMLALELKQPGEAADTFSSEKREATKERWKTFYGFKFSEAFLSAQRACGTVSSRDKPGVSGTLAYYTLGFVRN